MAYKAPKPTEAQLAEGRIRASASGISMNQSAKGLRNASKVIIAGASLLPAGRVVKAASTASKMAKTADARRKFNAATERRILDNQVKKSVKVLPRKTAPKTDLSSRGAKPTTRERINRARDLQWNKAEKNYEQRFDTAAGGPRAGGSSSGNPGQKNLRKTASLNKAADKKLPVQINSANSSTSRTSGNMFRGTDILKANNARALKAANKPVSKSNRNRFGDGEMSAYLKSAKPARANRTRSGNKAK